MFLITSTALDTDWLSILLVIEFVHVTFGAGLPVAEQLTMTLLPSITSSGDEKLLFVICGGTEKTSLRSSSIEYSEFCVTLKHLYSKR